MEYPRLRVPGTYGVEETGISILIPILAYLTIWYIPSGTTIPERFCTIASMFIVGD